MGPTILREARLTTTRPKMSGSKAATTSAPPSSAKPGSPPPDRSGPPCPAQRIRAAEASRRWATQRRQTASGSAARVIVVLRNGRAAWLTPLANTLPMVCGTLVHVTRALKTTNRPRNLRPPRRQRHPGKTCRESRRPR
ncbi:hypothetical protein DMB66_51645 [Actinoplanes sp. ATCC 53533]|nr:hypothetical protein DMB66_51645 [Actinoplanes sp. ATCC 53533]